MIISGEKFNKVRYVLIVIASQLPENKAETAGKVSRVRLSEKYFERI